MNWRRLGIEMMGMTGVAVMSYGAWLAWAPAGFIVGGVSLIGIAISLVKVGGP